jgi:hypothetical protein
MPRKPNNSCGRVVDGNLPDYNVGKCIDNVITLAKLTNIQNYFPWVGLEDFHYYHIKCPFSTESNMHYAKDMDRNSPTYFESVNVEGSAVSHTSTSGIMIRFSRGSKHGWLCVDPNCPYYKGTASGTTTSGNINFDSSGIPYFYI